MLLSQYFLIGWIVPADTIEFIIAYLGLFLGLNFFNEFSINCFVMTPNLGISKVLVSSKNSSLNSPSLISNAIMLYLLFISLQILSANIGAPVADPSWLTTIIVSFVLS